MSRFTSAGLRFLKCVGIVLVFLGTGAFLLTGSQSRTVFTVRPVPQAEWKINSVYNNYIGGPIGVVLRTTVPVGVTVDLSVLPNVGDTVNLYRILPPVPPEIEPYYDQYYPRERDFADTGPRYSNRGEVEVRDRVIRQETRGNQRIIEVTYTFQYLQPIDFTRRFTEKVIRSPSISVRFPMLNLRTGDGEVRRDYSLTAVQDGTFYLVRRVEEGDQPIADLMVVRRNVSLLPHYLNLTAVGLLFGTLAAQGWSVIRRRSLRRRELGTSLSPSSSSAASISGLYASWQKSGEYRLFIEAVILYRKGLWGKPRPIDWLRATYILYGGRVLPDSEIKELFEYLISLPDQTPVEEVPRESVS